MRQVGKELKVNSTGICKTLVPFYASLVREKVDYSQFLQFQEHTDQSH